MTDAELTAALGQAASLAKRIGQAWDETDPQDLAERDASLVAKRQATALQRVLETWHSDRARRAADVAIRT